MTPATRSHSYPPDGVPHHEDDDDDDHHDEEVDHHEDFIGPDHLYRFESRPDERNSIASSGA